MMRSLSSAVAGLRTHQTKMDVIGNNIANVNTFGFKASRTTFADVYYQSLSSGSSASGSLMGGTNPTQIGYGSSVATIDVMITQSGMSSTDRALDVYISGDGFLVSKDTAGQFIYTRLGNLRFDGEGNLCDGNGNIIQGFPLDADGNPKINANGQVLGDELQGIRVDPKLLDQLTGIAISATGKIVGTLPGDSSLKVNPTLPPWINQNSLTIPKDSVYTGPVKFAMSGFCESADMEGFLGLSAGDIESMEMGTLALPEASYTVKVDADGNVNLHYDGDPTADPKIPAVDLNGHIKDGQLVLKSSSGEVGMTINLKAGVTQITANTGGTAVPLKYYYQMTTTDKGDNIVKKPDVPTLYDPSDVPLTLGDITMDIDTTKPITAFNGKMGDAETLEGKVLNIGNLVLAKFRNPSGLSEDGSSYFAQTFNSGSPVFVKPSLEGTGGLKSGNLEMSNVDLSKEFSDMITTQRGFQANSRIVTVSDEMLQELVNLKR